MKKPVAHAKPDHAHDPRVVELEVRFMHQQEMLESLSEVLVRQQSEMVRLDKRIKDLERRLEDAGSERPGIEKPPHY